MGDHIGFISTERGGGHPEFTLIHPRWPTVTQRLQSKRSYNLKVGDCEQSIKMNEQ